MNQNSVRIGLVKGVAADVGTFFDNQDLLAGVGKAFRENGAGKSGPRSERRFSHQYLSL
jgi:hypothetical protein